MQPSTAMSCRRVAAWLHLAAVRGLIKPLAARRRETATVFFFQREAEIWCRLQSCLGSAAICFGDGRGRLSSMRDPQFRGRFEIIQLGGYCR